MAVIAQDSFSQPDGDPWSAVWTGGLTPAGGGATVYGGAGQLTTGTTGGYSGLDRVARRFAGVSVANADLSLRLRFVGQECYPVLFARANHAMDTQTGYGFEINQPGWALQRFASYTPTTLASGTHSLEANRWYRARFRLVGTLIQGKLWADGDPEPTTWTFSVTDSGAGSIATAGAVGISVGGGAGGTARLVPLAGRSGLPWNSGVFYNNGALTSAQTFETWRNRPVDSIMYFPPRGSLGAIVHATSPSGSSQGWLRSDLTAFTGYRIISMGSQIQGENLTNAAAGGYNGWWESFGAALAANGWNDSRTIIRLNWEYNIPSWSWRNNNPNPTAYINAFRNVVTSVRTNAPTVRFNWCANKGPDQTGVVWTDSYPGNTYVDIIGLDMYDHWNKATTTTQFQQEAARTPGLEAVAAFARTNGKMIALDEWGVSWWANNVGGQDNPFFIDQMWQWFVANSDVLAYETYYNDPGAPANLNHILNTGLNPNAAAAYRAATRWGA